MTPVFPLDKLNSTALVKRNSEIFQGNKRISLKKDGRRFPKFKVDARNSSSEEQRNSLSNSVIEAMLSKDTFSQSSGYIAYASGREVSKWKEYNAAEIAKYYKKKPFLLLRRLLQISLLMGSWFGKRWIDKKLGDSEETFKVMTYFALFRYKVQFIEKKVEC